MHWATYRLLQSAGQTPARPAHLADQLARRLMCVMVVDAIASLITRRVIVAGKSYPRKRLWVVSEDTLVPINVGLIG